MRRALAALAIVLVLSSCTGRAAIASGVVLMTAGGIGVATGSPTEPERESSSCEGAHGYCWDLDLDYNGPTPGLGTLLFGAALVVFGFATLKQEDEKIAAERAAAGIVDPPAPPPPPPPPPPRSSDHGVWREVPPVLGDDAL
jgi:hypothetical protein